jgi:hypothetical protein
MRPCCQTRITQAAEDELKRLYSAKISQAWACEIFGLDQQGCILRPGLWAVSSPEEFCRTGRSLVSNRVGRSSEQYFCGAYIADFRLQK